MMPEQVMPPPKGTLLTKGGFQLRIVPPINALDIPIEFGAQASQAGPNGERSVLQVFIHMAGFPPRRGIGQTLPRGRAQPNLPPDAGSRHDAQLCRGRVRIRADGRHINDIDLRWLGGKQLEVSGRGPISQQQDLPGGSQLRVG